MSDDVKPRHGLGRGLSALLGDGPVEVSRSDRNRSWREVPIERLRPGRFQPRHRFDPAESEALVASIRERGILQPILVRRIAGGGAEESYEIVAGERRWRAAQQAQLHAVPVIVREFSDTEALQVALVENLQRQNLTPMEEGEGYKRLMDEFSHTQEQVAQAVGKSRSHVANSLRLLGLPDEVKAMVDDGRLTAGHARALLVAPDPAALALRAVRQGLNVRQLERIVQKRPGRTRAATVAAPKPADTIALERQLTNALGLSVVIEHKADGSGQVVLAYRTLEQLDEICRRLTAAGAAPAKPDPKATGGNIREFVTPNRTPPV